MNRKAMGFAALLVGPLATGCGSGGQQAPEASVKFDAAVDAAVGDTTSADTTSGSDGEPDTSAKPLPMASAGSHLIVAGPAALIGRGSDSCTNQFPPIGDRWCGFARPASIPGFSELWVINATQAAAGVAIKCDTTDANCIRLSGSLFNDAAHGFAGSGFNGDTLIYEETTIPLASTSPFIGVIYAWRPGWTGGRKLTTSSGLFCNGQARSDSAYCFDNPQGDGMTAPLTIDLHAGHLSDPGGPTLPMIDTLIMAVGSDPVGATPAYQFGMSPDGAYVVWSARPTPSGVETLEAQKIGDDNSRRMLVAEDVSQWGMSPDGLAWYWLKGYNYDVTGAPSGTLQAATFPDGSGATTLATGVGNFSIVGDNGLSFRANVTDQVGTLMWMANRGAPADVTTVDTKVLVVFDQSRDGTTLVYSKKFTTLSSETTGTSDTSTRFDLVDLYVGFSTGAAPCVLAATPTAFQGSILPSGSAAVWERFNQVTGEMEGLDTTVSSCTSAEFTASLRNLLPVSDQGYIYLDDTDASADESTLRYAQVTGGALVAPGAPIQTRAASVFAPLLPALSAVMYTVGTMTSADGLYINTALPFAASAAAP
jgi:hypothetical protein